MIQVTANMLFTFQDIQEACIKLGFDNIKLFDELTGFPNGKDKCKGILEDDWVLAIDIYGVTYGIKNADGILLGGSDMVNVQKNLSPDLLGR